MSKRNLKKAAISLTQRLAKRDRMCFAELLEGRVMLSTGIAAFGGQLTFATTASQTALAAMDVNGDGNPDVLAAENSLGVSLGNGDGTFATERTFAPEANGNVSFLAVADFNGDGKPDVFGAALSGIYATVWLGNGDGSFHSQRALTGYTMANAVATADVNGDGRPDVLVATARGSGVNVLLGNGDGTFAVGQTCRVGLEPYGIAPADLNGDGKIDLAVATTVNTVSVLLGKGDGTFAPQRTLNVGGPTWSVAAADVNRDGKVDLVVGGSVTAVMLGNADGSFQSPATLAATYSSRSLVAVDLNSDGKPDVASVGFPSGSSTVSVWLGNGDATFQPRQTFSAGSNAFAVMAADLNRDGRMDLATANLGAKYVSVMLGDPPPVVTSINRAQPAQQDTVDDTLVFSVTFSEPVTGVNPSDFAVVLSGASANPTPTVAGSGSSYLVIVNGVSGTGTVGLNLVDDGSIRDAAGNPLQPGSAGAFQAKQTFVTGNSPSSLAVADLNRDGKPDLVTSDSGDGTLSVLPGNGNGTFATRRTLLTGVITYGATAADINGDGKPDLVITESTGVAWMAGNGDGTFAPQHTLLSTSSDFLTQVQDVNADGRPDIVSIRSNGTVFILAGNGDGSFKAPVTFDAGPVPNSMALCDTNGDGRIDVVVTNRNAFTISVLLGNGNATFAARRTFSAGTLVPTAIAMGDLNRDGKPDIIIGGNSGTGGYPSLLLGNGDGSFALTRTFSTVYEPGSIALADVNEDGRLDVITGNVANRASVSVLLGNGDGTLQPEQILLPRDLVTAASGQMTAVAADVDCDGKVDVLAANIRLNNVDVFLRATDGSFAGQTYNVTPPADTITGTSGNDSIVLSNDPDGTDLDWVMGNASGRLATGDPRGLTIFGNGGSDNITLNNSNGSVQIYKLNLNGTFTLNGFDFTHQMPGTIIDVNSSTLYVPDAGVAGVAAGVRAMLQNGYHGGAWDGYVGPASGSIRSSTAAAGGGAFAVGYADSADGTVAGQPANTVEIRYTAAGDANLDRVVDSNDAILLGRNYLLADKFNWDQGNFNFDSTIDLADATTLQANYGNTAGAVSAVNSAESVKSPSSVSPIPGNSAPDEDEGTADDADGKGLRRVNVAKDTAHHAPGRLRQRLSKTRKDVRQNSAAQSPKFL